MPFFVTQLTRVLSKKKKNVLDYSCLNKKFFLYFSLERKTDLIKGTLHQQVLYTYIQVYIYAVYKIEGGKDG